MSKKQYCTHCKNMQRNKDLNKNPKEDEFSTLDYRSHVIKDCPRLKTTICFNCNEVGHTPKYCTEPPKICILCQQVGHVETHCGYQSQIFASVIEFKKPIKNLPFEQKSWNELNQ